MSSVGLPNSERPPVTVAAGVGLNERFEALISRRKPFNGELCSSLQGLLVARRHT